MAKLIHDSKKASPAHQVTTFYPNPGPALNKGVGRVEQKLKEQPQHQTKTLRTPQTTQTQRLKPQNPPKMQNYRGALAA